MSGALPHRFGLVPQVLCTIYLLFLFLEMVSLIGMECVQEARLPVRGVLAGQFVSASPVVG